MTAETAKRYLIEGNEHFKTGNTKPAGPMHRRRMELAENGQKPFALILCCSDSRVPPEILFDQGLGDLFVIRTAGNVLDEIGMGTVEYGAAHLHIPLIVVLGHEQCGAVHATLSGEEAHGCLKAVIEKIRPAMRQTADCTDAYEACTDANIQNTLEEIRENSVIEKLLSAGTLEVIGAKYQMRSGAVDFWE